MEKSFSHVPAPLHHCLLQRRRDSRGGAEGADPAPSDTISRGDTKRKKLTNFVGKMVKK